MKTVQTLIPLFVVGLLVLFSCEPEEKISEIPQVGFKSLDGPFLVEEGTITLFGADLIFDFRDGDSDFGVDTNLHPNDTNLFIIPFQKINSTYIPIDESLYGRFYTISQDPKLNRDGVIKGEIKVRITYLVKPPFDTIRYEFYIMDRAGNRSNSDVTIDFVW